MSVETDFITLRRTDGSVIWEGNAYDAGQAAEMAFRQGLSLQGVNLCGQDLDSAALAGADLRDADLRGAELDAAELERTDLRGAKFDLAIPVIPNIHAAVYAAAAQPKALDMSDWHVCQTTHCRAGWVVSLAGPEGKALEEKVGTGTAAALIYITSDPELERIPNWYDTNDYALADMARLAGVQ